MTDATVSDATIIHCLCHRGAFDRVLAVLLPDGRLEMRKDGKSSTVSGGTVDLACKRCGFEREMVLDSEAVSVVG